MIAEVALRVLVGLAASVLIIKGAREQSLPLVLLGWVLVGGLAVTAIAAGEAS